MKTAIITFQDAENYGAALQAHALKTVINEYSECEILNYYNLFFHNSISSDGVKRIILDFLNKKNRMKKKERFSKFQTEYITDGKKVLSKDELREYGKKFDCFITGSDQVWNLECSGNDTTYFLDFVEDAKKISYAASFGGVNIIDKEKIRQLLCDFSKISVREKSGQLYLKDILGKVVPVVLDPTFLLDKNKWKTVFDLKFSERYVLVYEVLASDELFIKAKKFAKEKGLPLLCITSTNKPRIGAKVVKDAGPEEWLKYFSQAAYIFTNSFHGLAFALNFDKQFFVELLPPPAKTNTRIKELLELVDLTDRKISNCMDISDINYKKINKILNLKREESINYIKVIFNEMNYPAEVGRKENSIIV